MCTRNHQPHLPSFETFTHTSPLLGLFTFTTSTSLRSAIISIQYRNYHLISTAASATIHIIPGVSIYIFICLFNSELSCTTRTTNRYLSSSISPPIFLGLERIRNCSFVLYCRNCTIISTTTTKPHKSTQHHQPTDHQPILSAVPGRSKSLIRLLHHAVRVKAESCSIAWSEHLLTCSAASSKHQLVQLIHVKPPRSNSSQKVKKVRTHVPPPTISPTPT